MAYKPDLSKLPRNFTKISKNWYYDSKTGNRIHKDQIGRYIPKPADEGRDWTKRYDNY